MCPSVLSLDDVERHCGSSARSEREQLSLAKDAGEVAVRAMADPVLTRALSASGVKLCPNPSCRVPIEKNGGCPKVHCFSCGAAFTFDTDGVDPITFEGGRRWKDGGAWRGGELLWDPWEDLEARNDAAAAMQRTALQSLTEVTELAGVFLAYLYVWTAAANLHLHMAVRVSLCSFFGFIYAAVRSRVFTRGDWRDLGRIAQEHCERYVYEEQGKPKPSSSPLSFHLPPLFLTPF